SDNFRGRSQATRSAIVAQPRRLPLSLVGRRERLPYNLFEGAVSGRAPSNPTESAQRQNRAAIFSAAAPNRLSADQFQSARQTIAIRLGLNHSEYDKNGFSLPHP